MLWYYVHCTGGKRDMGLTPEQQNVLQLMRGIAESYRTLRVGSANTLKRLAQAHFKVDLDIAPTIVAIQSRRGNLIIAEINRLQTAIREIEEHST